MEILDIISIVGQGITFVGVIFIVYHYFRNPQIKSEKLDALLEQKVKLTNESNDRRFCEIQSNIKNAFELAQNHTHTVEVSVNTLVDKVNDMGKDVVRLQTIIEERIPKKL